MPDQSLLSPKQDQLMFNLSIRWQAVQESGGEDPARLLAGLQAAHEALLEGGSWPDDLWLEEIFMIGANCGAAAVLNHGMYPQCKQAINDLYGRVIELKWVRGGPSGQFDANEASNLSRAVGQWQVQPGAMDRVAEEKPKKKRFGIF